jgi:uncharacterized protein
MKKYSIFVIVIIILIGIIYALGFRTVKPAEIEYEQLIINDKVINIEIADTNEKKAKGLGDRQSLQQEHGMLFVFEDKHQYGFWMKGMQFPLDIIWLDDNKIVDISKNVQVENENSLSTYKPKTPINYVLEVNAGYVDQNDIKIGDIVEFVN